MATLLPPPQYDVPPQIPMIEHVLSFEEIYRHCGPQSFLACGEIMQVDQYRRRCDIWLVAAGRGVLQSDYRWITTDAAERIISRGTVYVVTPAMQAELRRHERAHCNGWPKDHPGGWYDAPLR